MEFKSDKGKEWKPINEAAKAYVAKRTQKYSQVIQDEVSKLRVEAKKKAYDVVDDTEKVIKELLKYGFKAVKNLVKKEK